MNLLVVGAGGIGSELLKNLALAKYTRLTIVDLDTIELSNLNRQLLFRRSDIGASKAHTAKQAILRISPLMQATPSLIAAFHADITDTSAFPVGFFQQFGAVLNALDNLKARRHVNRMCVAVRVPLIESGTAGLLGQTSCIVPFQTECFDCQPKPVPKTFPVCTIRTSPTELIHCVVWAKEVLLPLLFPADCSADGPATASDGHPDDAQDDGHHLLVLPSDELGICTTVFISEVAKLQTMSNPTWKTEPTPLELRAVENAIAQAAEATSLSSHSENVPTLAQSLTTFVARLRRLRSRNSGGVAFGKDDEDVMLLVAAAANIRAHIFHIPPDSFFKIKEMAGNIIPAIATTNAIIAGLMVLRLNSIAAGRLSECNIARNRNISAENIVPPNPQCATCSVNYHIVRCDTVRTLLGDLARQVCVQFLETEFDPDSLTVSESARILCDPDLLDTLSRPLSDLGLQGCSFVRVECNDKVAVAVVVHVPTKRPIEEEEEEEGSENEQKR